MNFAELRFWELLLGGLGGILVLRWLVRRFFTTRPEVDRCGLLLLGLILLLAVSRVTFLIFLAVAVGTYFGLWWVLRTHGRAPRRYLLVLLPLQLLPLFYYKYANFVANGVLGLNVDALSHLIIPVGISFYTFQKIAFVLDTLAFQEPLPHFLDYMNFAGFFPQIVAGPIERRRNLLPQMQSFHFVWNAEFVDSGVSWIVIGFYFKCCLADNLAELFQPLSVTNAYVIWINNLLFGLRIYYDFAGYSLIAVGLARCLGMQLTLNFESPYCSTSVSEFWRRWHITLSQWFRDYLYVPLGGGRVSWWAANLLVVFLVSGIWHGAGWNFVLWGALHGLFLIANRLLARKWRAPTAVNWILTMLAVFLAWLCFYETHFPNLILKLKTLVTWSEYSMTNLRALDSDWTSVRLFFMACMLGLVAMTLFGEWLSVRCAKAPFAFFRKPVILILLVILTILLSPGKNNGFIYFAF